MQNIDAVIVTYNRLFKLQHALECYDKQTIPFRTIIVVDNNSSDGTIEFLKEWETQKTNYKKHVIYLPQNIGGSGGFYGGEKYALKLNPDWVYVSDDDAYPEEQMVEKFLNFSSQHQGETISAICAAISDKNGRIINGHRCHDTIENHTFYHKEASDEEYQMPSFEFNSLSYVASFLAAPALREKGLVNKDFFIYQDDVEHSFRLSTYGTMYCIPDMIVCHDSISDMDDTTNILWKEYYAVRNSLYMLFEKSFRVGWKALHEKMSSIHAHFDNSLSPVDKMTLEGCKDACLSRLGMHPIYRPGLDVRTATYLPYPKYLWKMLYWIFRVTNIHKK